MHKWYVKTFTVEKKNNIHLSDTILYNRKITINYAFSSSWPQ